IRVGTNSATIRYILDFAEIPTFQMGAQAAPDQWVRGLLLESDAGQSTLRLNGFRRELMPGAAGLSTMKVTMDVTASWESVPKVLHFADRNFPDRIGWKEIVVESDGSISFPYGNPYSSDRSNGLSNYSPDLLSNAPSVVDVTLKTG